MTDSALEIIDTHLHFFNLAQGDYHWLKPQNPPKWPDKHLIHKSLSQADLSIAEDFKLSGFVHIEAGFDNQKPWREIDWLEQHCTGTFKTVAFADITSTKFTKHIEQLTQRQSVVGIRFILDQHANKILSSPIVKHQLALLAENEFSFDAQFSLLDILATDALITVANQNKELQIIINHAGWAPNKNELQNRQLWQTNLLKLAKCKNIAIKLSGWEMLDRDWHADHVSAVTNDCINRLGDDRVMLASNFPLCLFSLSYSHLWQSYADLPAISRDTFKKITFSNAKSWYKFS